MATFDKIYNQGKDSLGMGAGMQRGGAGGLLTDRAWDTPPATPQPPTQPWQPPATPQNPVAPRQPPAQYLPTATQSTQSPQGALPSPGTVGSQYPALLQQFMQQQQAALGQQAQLQQRYPHAGQYMTQTNPLPMQAYAAMTGQQQNPSVAGAAYLTGRPLEDLGAARMPLPNPSALGAPVAGGREIARNGKVKTTNGGFQGMGQQIQNAGLWDR